MASEDCEPLSTRFQAKQVNLLVESSKEQCITHGGQGHTSDPAVGAVERRTCLSHVNARVNERSDWRLGLPTHVNARLNERSDWRLGVPTRTALWEW